MSTGSLRGSPYTVALPDRRTSRRGWARYLAPLALALLVATFVVVAFTPRLRLPVHVKLHNPLPHAKHARVVARRVPPYWIVRPGDTLAQIADKTGLSVEQLQTFNPQADPSTLLAGQRLNLWRHPPHATTPARPQFWIVRAGQSFGLIAAKTGINLSALEELNPQLSPTALQPGVQVRLRR